jgi:hypothetical protein
MQCVNMLPIVYRWNKSSRMLLRDYWVCNAVKDGIHEQLTMFFSVTKHMFAAFYFNRSRRRVDKRSLKAVHQELSIFMCSWQQRIYGVTVVDLFLLLFFFSLFFIWQSTQACFHLIYYTMWSSLFLFLFI